MKILIINPNSSAEMTADIDQSAKEFAAGDFQVDTLPTPGAPEYIDTYKDQAICEPGMMKLIQDNEDKYDAFVIACHCDPNLDLMKELSMKPVVGIGESSMKMATMIGHRFSVISTGNGSTPNKEAMIHKYFLDGCAGPVRSPGEVNASCDSFDLFMDAGRKAIDEDMSEVLVLGCAGMCGLSKRMEKELGVPVLDGVVCALILATGMVKAGITISKKRRYSTSSED